jgi:DNA (cytosine-5)-methyltransferase 1
MLTPQFVLPLAREIVIDLFAGGGGASTGIEEAIGRPVDIAINHNIEAVAMHLANHPQTKHYVSDVLRLIRSRCGWPSCGHAVGKSPDCKHFSKAKGGKPVSKKIRGLAWVVIKWAKLVRPRVIFLENVEEFQTWGPLDENNMPCPRRKGRTFARWKKSLENLGYKVHYQEDRACDLGTPTIRKRLFLVARCDGEPIVVPQYTHAPPDSLLVKTRKAKPYRTAAECIMWDQPAPSIFERSRELAEATKRRIAKGIMRYVVNADQPFIVPLTHQGGDRVEGLDEPFKTITGANRGEKALIVPTLIQTGYGERPGQAPRVPGLEKPLGTLVARRKARARHRIPDRARERCESTHHARRRAVAHADGRGQGRPLQHGHGTARAKQQPSRQRAERRSRRRRSDQHDHLEWLEPVAGDGDARRCRWARHTAASPHRSSSRWAR